LCSGSAKYFAENGWSVSKLVFFGPVCKIIFFGPRIRDTQGFLGELFLTEKLTIKLKLHVVQKYKLGKILLFLFFYRVEGVWFSGVAKIFSKKSRHKPIREPSKVSKR